MKRWSIVFKALGNVNRLKIVKLLAGGERRSVTEIAGVLGISQKATSKHLIQLQRLDVLDSAGKDGHVFYFLNRTGMPKDFRRILGLL
ncbi:MAG: metalloregulator ArsR/SmtB family transcription factor [Candidatus Jorgensenbacteria bacterium]